MPCIGLSQGRSDMLDECSLLPTVMRDGRFRAFRLRSLLATLLHLGMLPQGKERCDLEQRAFGISDDRNKRSGEGFSPTVQSLKIWGILKVWGVRHRDLNGEHLDSESLINGSFDDDTIGLQQIPGGSSCGA